MQEKIKIGTRGSNLALWQTNKIESLLSELYPDLIIERVIVKTKGDAILDQALSKIEGKGLFTSEIEARLLAGEIDLAVHSLKDMPTELPEGLTLAAICCREDASEALLSKDGLSLEQLPQGAIVLTGSLRRRSQILSQRPDLIVSEVRGNIETRLRKYQQGPAQAMILASAGLKRLGLEEHITNRLEPGEFIPACGQGALAIEVKATDDKIIELLAGLDDYQARTCTDAERTFLSAMGGGCHQPMGAYCRFINDKTIEIKAFCGEPDGSSMRYCTMEAGAETAKELGARVAENILGQM